MQAQKAWTALKTKSSTLQLEAPTVLILTQMGVTLKNSKGSNRTKTELE